MGIKQRDEAIKKRDELIKKQKREKEMLAKQIKDFDGEKETLRVGHDRLKQQLDEIRNESKLGEEILLNQLKEIRSEN
jgi:septal ring factor EnvC (AmiA/AmiB activator)